MLAHLKARRTRPRSRCSGYSDQVFEIAQARCPSTSSVPDHGRPTVNQGFGGVLFKPWDRAQRAARSQLQLVLQQKWAQIAGAQVFAFQFPPLPGSQGLPGAVRDHDHRAVPEPQRGRAGGARTRRCDSGMFWFVDSDLKLDKPQATIEVDRDKVAALGLTQQDVGSALGAALGGGYVNYFSISGRSYKVIPQVLQMRSAESRPGARLLHPRPRRRGDPGAHRGAHQVPIGTRVDQPLPAAELGDDRGRQRHGAGRCAASSCAMRSREVAPQRLHRRLFGPVAAVRAGVRRLRRHALLRDRSSCFWRSPRSSRASAIRS